MIANPCSVPDCVTVTVLPETLVVTGVPPATGMAKVTSPERVPSVPVTVIVACCPSSDAGGVHERTPAPSSMVMPLGPAARA